jgi:hypothetical protein
VHIVLDRKIVKIWLADTIFARLFVGFLDQNPDQDNVIGKNVGSPDVGGGNVRAVRDCFVACRFF